MGAGATEVIVLAAVAWFAVMVLICATLRATTRPPWWESAQLDIESLDSRERSSYDDLASDAEVLDAR
jgi:hypothetical protein